VVAPGTVLVGVNVGFVQPPGGTVNIVRWFRDGHVAGIGSPSLKVEEADLGSTLVQVASFWTSGDCPPKALGVTQTWKVEAKATVKMSAKEMTVAKGRRATATVKVKADGVKPEGKVKVSWGKNSKTVFMGAADKGRVEVQLPKLAQGRHKVAVDFTDLTGKISESKTERLTLKVK
jgi:hypothetical protein